MLILFISGLLALAIFLVFGGFAIKRQASNTRASESTIRSLREERRRLATAVDQAAETIVITDLSGTIQYANPAFERITGYTVAEALGQNSRMLKSGYQDADFYQQMWDTISAGTVWTGRFTNRRKDGSLYEEEASISPVTDGHGKIVNFIAVKQDVTARVRAEAEVLVLNAALVRTVEELRSANHDLEAFSFTVSHDLRAPLHTVGGFATMLANERERLTPEDVSVAIGAIRRSTTKMTALIEELLAFARLGKQEMTRAEIDMTALVHEVYADLDPQRDGRSIRFSVAPLPTAQGDIGMMRQVFVNLQSNAIKYTRKIADASIEIGTVDKNGAATYFIRDNGTGFDMLQADKLFKPFQRLHSSEDFEGTGVGLSIVRRVIERHDGKVWAEAFEGRGATFYFTIGL